MSDLWRTGAGHEAPPLVRGLVMRASARVARTMRRALARIERGRLLRLWAAATLLVFAGTLLLTFSRSAEAAGMLGAILAALFAALLFAGAAAWLLMWGLVPPVETPADAAEVAALEALLAPALRELAAVRADVIETIGRRSIVRVPLATAGACLLCLPFFVWQWGDEPTGFVDLIAWAFVGAVAGEAWAAGTLPGEYRQLYKDRVLPRLAARLGGLTYRRGSAGAVEPLRAHGILTDFETVVADDEIAGTHRGLSLSITEVRLLRDGHASEVVFDGLLIGVMLPRTLAGTTVVAAKGGLLGCVRTGGLQRVRLEDPRFEARYRIHGTDQIEARALLTPAFMERFTALGALSGFSLPGALTDGNRLMIALPKNTRVDLFEPPPYWKPAGGRALLALGKDIAAVLGTADAVIDLDFFARGRALEPPQPAGSSAGAVLP